MTPFELMALNRHQRRAIGKINGIKIPGTNRADLEIKRQKDAKLA